MIKKIADLLSCWPTENHRLWLSIINLAWAMRRVRSNELRKYGLSNAEAAILFFTIACDMSKTEPTVTNISRLTVRSHASVSEILSRMEKRGLIRKKQNSKNKRMLRIVVPEKVQQLYKASFEEQAIDRILSSLSSEERQQLLAIVNKLQDSTSKEFATKINTTIPNLIKKKRQFLK